MATAPGSFAGLGGNPNLVPSTSGITTMSGIGPLTGFGIVAGAAMGGGPWQDISNFLGGFGSMKRRHMEARAPGDALNQSINTFLNEKGLGSYKTSGKMATSKISDTFKRRKNLSKVLKAVKDKYPGYTQWQYAEMLKPNNIHRFMPGISVSDAKESRKQELLNPKTDPAWTTPEQMKKKHGKGLMNAQRRNQQLLAAAALHKEYYGQENFNYRPKELRGRSSSEAKWQSRRADMTMEGFFKNIYSSIEDDTFLDTFRTGTPEPEALTGGTASSMATGGMGRISSGSGMGAAPKRSQYGMARQA